MPFRSLRSSALFASVLLVYFGQWVLWRASGRRLLRSRWEAVHRWSARRLAKGFERLGGVFIKLGQVLSVLGTFLPRAYADELELLQDAVPQRSFDVIRPRLEAAWGPHWTQRFSEFDERALAAASLSQVHRARLNDGTLVAVKVLYPDIHRIVRSDLRVLGWVLPVVHRAFGFRRAGSVLEQLSEMLERETDYRHERANIARLRSLLEERTEVIVPHVFDELSSDAVLVMSFETGTKLGDPNELRASGSDPKALADVLVDCYLSMLLEHRTFHADPHPGNFLARGGQLVMLDYGAVAEVSEELVSGLSKVILGGLSRDADKVLAGIEEMGFVAEGGDRELLREVGREYLQALGSMQLGNVQRLSADQLRGLSGVDQLRGRLRRVAASVRYPEGYFYLERTLMLLFGVVGRLDPERGLLGVAAPHASRALMRGYARRASAGPRG